MPAQTVSAEVEPRPGQAQQAARALQQLGFRVLHIGSFSISLSGPPELWAATFNVSFAERRKKVLADLPNGETTYQAADTSSLRIPPELEPLVAAVYFQEPPDLH